MQSIVTHDLPRGFGNDWAGQSLQEILSGAQAPMLFALSILIVYLCLAALYESWSIPGGGADGGARGPHRLGRGGAPARASERCVLQGRPHHDHRTDRQERHPDRRVRGRGAALGQEPAPGGAGGGTPALPADSHDLLRLHPRGVPDGDLQRRGRQRAPRHRHRRRRRHAERRGARGAADPGVLRCRAAAARGQARRARAGGPGRAGARRRERRRNRGAECQDRNSASASPRATRSS